MLHHKYGPSFVLLFTLLFPSITGDLEPTFSRCCHLGVNWGQEGLQCPSFPAPVTGIPAEQQAVCLSAVQICCLRKHRERQCEAGKLSAKADKECRITRETGGEFHRDCCEGCKLGLVAGTMAMGCGFRSFKFGSPWDEAYLSCCQQILPQSSYNTPPPARPGILGPRLPGPTLPPPPAPTHFSATVPTPSPQDPAGQDLCALFPNELCAQICVPTPNSYRCECREGFNLLADGKSCQQTTQVDRCVLNNPCSQKCIDTGLAIECACNPGYQLGSDLRNCHDVDECSLGTDNCDPLAQVCVNEPGSFRCITSEGGARGRPSSGSLAGGGSAAGARGGQDSARCPLGFRFNFQSRVCDDIDECVNPRACPAPSSCQNTIGSFTCLRVPVEECRPGYRFDLVLRTCVDIDECENPDTCPRTKPLCINTPGSFVCQWREPIIPSAANSCPAGYKYNTLLQSCEDIDECAESVHNCTLGTQACINAVGAFRCVDREPTCSYGYRYNNTQNQCVDIDECAEDRDVCSRARERCVNEPGGYRCVPLSPLTTSTTTTTTTTTTPPPPPPTRAQTLPPPPPQVPHSRNCPTGHRYDAPSRRCVDINECADSNPCRGNQQCENTVGSYACRCAMGFRFNDRTQQCEDINECSTDTHNCLPSQRCDNTVGSYSCVRIISCGTGYTFNSGTGECEDDDECALGTDSCHRLGKNFVCRNTQGSFRCERRVCDPGFKLDSSNKCVPIVCPDGYILGPKDQCVDIDECARNPCSANQRCINTVGSYSCQDVPRSVDCGRGYEFSDAERRCVDVDECARGTHDCRRGQTCQNKPGGYDCTCPQGYQLKDGNCVDFDECEHFGGSQLCGNHQCINTPGSYRCDCKEGFRTQGQNCVDIDECSETPRLCQHNCVNTWGSYQCTCDAGYTLNADNRSCQDIDECEQYRERGLCNGLCVNKPGSYACSCPDGYRLASDGRTCQDIDECATGNRCQRDEICLNTRGGYHCNSIVCPTNYVRDQEHRNRCKRSSLECHTWDIECQRRPVSYSYNFLTFPSKIPIPRTGSLDLFTMRGPNWPTSRVEFKHKVLPSSSLPSPGVAVAGENFFRLRTMAQNQAVLALTQSVHGPQVIDLELVMDMYQAGVFGGVAVAKIKIYVTQYEF